MTTARAFDDAHVSRIAHEVAAVDASPRGPFDTAVVLEMLGYNDDRAQAVGAPNVFSLAESVYEYVEAMIALDPVEDVAATPRWPNAKMLLRGMLFSAPWLTAMAALFIARTSLWSTITTTQFSSTISVALFIALVLSGAFIQAYARRATFYRLQGNRALLVSVTIRMGAALLAVALGVFFALYYLFEDVLAVYTPASNLKFLEFGVAITVLLSALAPLYMTYAVGWLTAATLGGAGFVVVAAHETSRGDYLNMYVAMRIGLAGIGIVVAIAVAGSVVVLRRPAVDAPCAAPTAVQRPRGASVVITTAPYAIYGGAFFVLLTIDQLVEGGLLRGGFTYDGRYQLAVAVALLVLIPTLSYVVAVQHLLPETAKGALARPTTELADSASTFREFYRRHLGVLLALGIAAASMLTIAMYEVGRYAGPGSALPDIRHDLPVFVAAVAAYVLLAVGTFNSGLSFALSRPWVPAVTIVGSSAVSCAIGGTLFIATHARVGPAVGLLCGCALFAALTTITTSRVFASFVTHYYAAA